jgi:hypothetical protein
VHFAFRSLTQDKDEATALAALLLAAGLGNKQYGVEFVPASAALTPLAMDAIGKVLIRSFLKFY